MSKIAKQPITLRDVEVLRSRFRNFSGGPTKFNPQGGSRFFNIRLSPEKAAELRESGWRVKTIPAREDYEEAHILKVNVNYGGREAPKIVLVTEIRKTPIGEAEVDLLDHADIDRADLILNPYRNPNSDEDLVTAYLQRGHFYIKLDELELEFALEETEGSADEVDQVICDEEGVCYINGVRIN